MTGGALGLGAPWFLLALIPVAAAPALLWWRRKKGKDPAMRFSSHRLVAGLPRTGWARLWWLPDALRIAALVAFVGALARPQVMGTPDSDDAEGIDIVLALDTSGSMQAADFQPKDRMTVAKASIEAFVKGRTRDRIGLVVFAGEAASWVPLTLDYSLVAQMLEEVEVGMLPDGTAIGSAVGTALNRLRASDAESRVIVLLTDGDSNAGSITPKKAAEFAKELGVKIYTILIGKDGPVPFPAGKDLFGRPVYREATVPTDPALLEDLAKTTGGQAYVAKDGEELDARLNEVLDALDRSRLEATVYTAPKAELFPYFVLAGVLLLAVELALSATRLRRFP
jgi:Ca-activated chloride channel family protein